MQSLLARPLSWAQFFSRSSFDPLRWYAGLLAFAVAFAIVAPYRVAPIPNFLPETFVVLISVLALVPVLARMREGVMVLWSAGACLAFAAWLFLSQRIYGTFYPDALAWPIASLLAGAGACLVGAELAQRGNLRAVAVPLAIGWVAASAGTLIAQGYQLFYPDVLFDWVIPRPPGMQPYGNLAQRNQAASVHALALLSLVYLAVGGGRWKVALRAGMVVLALGAVAGLALTGSRIGSLLGGWVACVAAFTFARSQPLQRQLLAAILAAAAFFLVYALFSAWLFSLPTMSASHSVGTRWATYGTHTRVALLLQSWDMFRANPLIGSGWLSYSLESLRRVDELRYPQFAGNAHNLIAHLAAETGLVGLTLVVLPLLAVMHRAMRHPGRGSPEFVFLAGMVGLFLVYSMTEFPLWHTFFLLPFAFALGALDRPVGTLRVSAGMRALLVALALGIAAGACWALDRYATMARLVGVIYRIGHPTPEMRADVIRHLNSPGFAEQTELLAYGLLSVDAEDLDKKIALGERVVAYHIDAFMLQKQASLLALAGDYEKGASYLVAACRFYPERCAFTIRSIRKVAAMDPKVFDPLIARFEAKAAADPRFPKLQ